MLADEPADQMLRYMLSQELDKEGTTSAAYRCCGA